MRIFAPPLGSTPVLCGPCLDSVPLHCLYTSCAMPLQHRPPDMAEAFLPDLPNTQRRFPLNAALCNVQRSVSGWEKRNSNLLCLTGWILVRNIELNSFFGREITGQRSTDCPCSVVKAG